MKTQQENEDYPNLTEEDLNSITDTEAKEEHEDLSSEKGYNEEEYRDNSDEAYERYRDDAGDMLYEKLKEAMKYIYNSKGNTYYSGKSNLDKLKQHAISDIQNMTAENFEEK